MSEEEEEEEVDGEEEEEEEDIFCADSGFVSTKKSSKTDFWAHSEEAGVQMSAPFKRSVDFSSDCSECRGAIKEDVRSSQLGSASPASSNSSRSTSAEF